MELNLIQSIHIPLDSFTHMGGEIVLKMKVLEQVIWSNILNRYRLPPRKKLQIMSTQAYLHIDREKALRINGLATREAHRQ